MPSQNSELAMSSVLLQCWQVVSHAQDQDVPLLNWHVTCVLEPWLGGDVGSLGWDNFVLLSVCESGLGMKGVPYLSSPFECTLLRQTLPALHRASCIRMVWFKWLLLLLASVELLSR
jgi:hypothetical protein